MSRSMYHGTRLQQSIGELIGQVSMPELEILERDGIDLTTNLDESIWDAELAPAAHDTGRAGTAAPG